MTAVSYTAKRSLIAGHTVNTVYYLDLPVVSMPIQRNVDRERQQSLNGNRETITFYRCEIWDVSLANMSGTLAAQVKEFLDSVEDGEGFTFDPYGSANTPNNPLPAEIESTGYNSDRTPKGQGGANDYFRRSFQLRVMA